MNRRKHIYSYYKYITGILLLAMFVGCSDNKQEQGNVVWALALNTILKPYQSCSMEGGIDFPDLSGCLSTRVDAGFIYNQITNERITTATITGTPPLECRSLDCPDSQSCRSSTLGKNWYKSDVSNPPAGYAVQLIYTHVFTYDSSGNVNGIEPFTNYTVGDTIICRSRISDTLYAYQMIDVL